MFHHIHTPFATIASKFSAQDWCILQMNKPDCSGQVTVKGHHRLTGVSSDFPLFNSS